MAITRKNSNRRTPRDKTEYLAAEKLRRDKKFPEDDFRKMQCYTQSRKKNVRLKAFQTKSSLQLEFVPIEIKKFLCFSLTSKIGKKILSNISCFAKTFWITP